MDKDYKYTELYEIYKGLLTDKQRELFSSYYYYDLSLSEIAEAEGNSRQSVYDGIKKVKEKLQEYESILGVYEKGNQLIDVSESQGEAFTKKIRDILGR